MKTSIVSVVWLSLAMIATSLATPWFILGTKPPTQTIPANKVSISLYLSYILSIAVLLPACHLNQNPRYVMVNLADVVIVSMILTKNCLGSLISLNPRV